MIKGISPVISAVIVVAIVFAIAALSTPWMFEITQNATNQTQIYQETSLLCQNTAYDFDTDYGTYGVSWNFSGTNDTLDVKIINTGSTNLRGFSIEILIDTTTGLDIKQLDVNSTYQRTGANPLKPGQTAILKANITQDLTGTLQEVKILNEVCPSFYVAQEL